jgi:filamentous hemagglutinin family protein
MMYMLPNSSEENSLRILTNSLVITVASLLLGIQKPTIAQITPDNALGAESSRVTPNVTVRNGTGDRVDGGAARGANLFHSFSEFNVNDGQRVYFANPDGIQNILTRVTGRDVSDILGTLGVDGNANLFLLNPNGIIFGQNSSLDIRGSFVGTTANGLQFGEQGVFSTINPAAPALLTVAPSALLFNQISGVITNRSRTDNLNVSANQSLLLVGGDINFDNAFAGIPAGGQLEVGGLAAPGIVELVPDASGWRLRFPSRVARSDVKLDNNSSLLRLGAGGSINIYADDIQVNNGSNIFTILQQGNINDQGGTIGIDATGTLTLSDSGTIGSGTLGDGIAGDIDISAQNITLINAGNINSVSTGVGRSGNINVRARDTVSLTSRGAPTIQNPDGLPSNILTSVNRNGSGDAGDVSLQARQLILTDAAGIGASNFGNGNAGNITINVSDTFRATGDASGLQAITTGQGNGGDILINAGEVVFSEGRIKPEAASEEAVATSGDITINTNAMTLSDRTQFVTNTSGIGDAGDITITVRDRFRITNSQISSQVAPGAVGNGGTIQVTAGSLDLLNGSQLTAGTVGRGNAGDIRVRVRDRMTLQDEDGDQTPTLISTSVGGGRLENGSETVISGDAVQGNGGAIDIRAGSLRLNNAQIQADSDGRGNSGNLRIVVSDRVSLNNSQVFTSIDRSGVGQGGTVRVVANSVLLTNNGQINSLTEGQGNAGSIRIITRRNSRDRIVIDGIGSQDDDNLTGIISSVEPMGIGRGGNIRLTTGTLVLRNQGQVFTGIEGQGSAGNVRIIARDRVLASGFERRAPIPGLTGISLDVLPTGIGNSGNLNITTDDLFLNNGAQLLARTRGQGNAGNIRVQADQVRLSGSDRDGIASNISVSSRQSATGRSGRGGQITINADALSLDRGAFLNARTQSDRRGGNITVNTNILTATRGGQIISSAEGAGRAGTIRLNVQEDLILSDVDPQFNNRRSRIRDYVERTPILNDRLRTVLANQGAASGIYANTRPGSTGEGGNVIINAQGLTVQDNAQISVGSRGSGEGGSVELRAESILLDRGQIISNTNRTNSGNINLQSRSLTLRDRSQISTNAGNAEKPGNGGNININADTLLAIPDENSDITANAFSGNGGAVNITTQGILGLETAPTNTDRSNITASSDQGVQGVVNLETPDTDPTQGLVQLPAVLTDASNQIDQTCTDIGNAGEDESKNEFIVSGRGGLPPSPLDALESSEVIGQLVLPAVESALEPQSRVEVVTPLVEAQGWTIAPDGQVKLIAASSATGQTGAIVPAQCHPR